MALTPLEVKKQEFDRVLRGYDPVAVDAFLELAAEEMGTLVSRVDTLEERVRGLKETLEDYRAMEKTLKDTMLSAQRVAEEAREAASRDAQLVIREANVEAEKIVAEADRRKESLATRIRELEVQERTFVRKMKSFLEEHLEALESREPVGDDAAGGEEGS